MIEQAGLTDSVGVTLTRAKLTFNKYQELAFQTAIYPRKGANLYYPSLGLGESGELQEKVLAGVNTAEDIKEVSKELGDVLWYVAAVTTEIGERMSSLFGDDFNEFQNSNKEKLSVVQCALGLGATGIIQNVVKKIMRDDKEELTVEKKAKIIEGLKSVMRYFAVLCTTLELRIEDVATVNIDKLFSRKDRGVLQGSGDNR